MIPTQKEGGSNAKQYIIKNIPAARIVVRTKSVFVYENVFVFHGSADRRAILIHSKIINLLTT